MASCSSPWSPFSGVGVFLLTSYLSISHLSLCEWPDIRLWAQTRCPLCGSSATTCGGTRRQHKATTPDTAATAKQHAKLHARQHLARMDRPQTRFAFAAPCSTRQFTFSTDMAGRILQLGLYYAAPCSTTQHLARLHGLHKLSASTSAYSTGCLVISFGVDSKQFATASTLHPAVLARQPLGL